MAELGSMPQALPLRTLMLGSLSLGCSVSSSESLTVALRAAQSRSRVDRPSSVSFTEVSLHRA